MGLFFDQDWFDNRLKAAGLTRSSLAQAAGMTVDEVEMVFNDRREFEHTEVRAVARILRVDAEEVANRSGAALPMETVEANPFGDRPSIRRIPDRDEPEFQVTREVIAGLHERMDRLERMLELVLSKLDRR